MLCYFFAVRQFVLVEITDEKHKKIPHEEAVKSSNSFLFMYKLLPLPLFLLGTMPSTRKSKRRRYLSRRQHLLLLRKQ
jgi:hypothetical protein